MGNEWYTPEKYIEAAWEVMGDIELDPASCAYANETVQATRYFTKEEDGLSQEWKARSVWLNPPYGRLDPENKGQTKSYQLLFAQKCLREYEQGNIEEAIMLVLGNVPFMQWFQAFWKFPLCFCQGRIRFEVQGGGTDGYGFGNTFVYMGPNEQKFREVFSELGVIVKRW